jgi:transcriptional regulator with XRE-family HTH domain
MSNQKPSFAPGFGSRLRAERKRLGLNQEQLADAASVKRLAQSQYEAEFREPRISYLAAIGAAGVDLYYLLFGRSVDTSILPPKQQTDVERRAFELIEEYAQTQCAGQLSSDGRFVLFRIIRAQLTRSVIEGAGMELSVSDLLASRSTSNG